MRRALRRAAGAVVAGLCLAFATPLPLRADPSPVDLLTPLNDETDDWRVRTLFTGRTLTFYGQISLGALVHDDGVSTRAYVPVDNSNSGTRAGLLLQLHPLFGHPLVLRAEAGVALNPTTGVNQTTGVSGFTSSDISLRKLELILDDVLGKGSTLYLGQGSMANDGIAEIDLSRTSVAAYSDVGSTAGGQFLRFSNGVLSTVQIGNVFDNYDGGRQSGYLSDGSRALRVRYDTPKWRGFTASFALGNDEVEGDGDTNGDVALRYDRIAGDYRVSGGIGFSLKNDTRVASGSLSVLHEPSGVNFTTSAGNSSDGGTYGYVKFGVIRSVFEFGDTAMSVDLYRGNDIAGNESQSTSFGLAMTQAIDARNIELFGVLRRHSYSIPIASYRDATSLLAGLRWKF